MINTEKSFDIHDYTEIFLRRIWYFLIPLIVILVAAILYAFSLPKSISCRDTDPGHPPESSGYVRQTHGDFENRRPPPIDRPGDYESHTVGAGHRGVQTLSGGRRSLLVAEEIVEMMRKNIQVEIKGKEGYFTISYIGKDPKIVTMVTNKLASLFIEENLKLREQQAQGTSDFLSVELNAMRAKLEEQEATVTDFKKKHMSELPEQRDANLKILEQLQLQSQKVSDNLKAAQDRKMIIQKQLSDMKIQMALRSPFRKFKRGRGPHTTTQSDLSQPPTPKTEGDRATTKRNSTKGGII